VSNYCKDLRREAQKTMKMEDVDPNEMTIEKLEETFKSGPGAGHEL
jgi:hypothetical protein